MLNLLKNLQLVQLNKLFLVSILFLIASCEKDPGLPGGGSGDNLDSLDSLVLTAYSIADEAKNSLNEGDVALGRLDDPRFGESIASFYSELSLSINAFEPGANASLDSIILVLDVEDTYGPLDNSLDFEVYRLTEELDASSSYLADADLSVGASLIGGKIGFNYNDSSTLRIPMESSFGDELLGLFGTSTMNSNDDFVSYLNGIYVTVNPNSGGDGLFDIELISDASSLQLYFSSDDPEDSLYTFNISTTDLRVNRYQHDAAGSELETALNDASNNDENLLLGGLQVSKGLVELPDLSVLEGAIINQATLTFYQSDYGSALNTDYENPEFLLLTGGITTDTIQYFLSDYSTSNPSAYGGTPELVDVNGMPTFAYSYSIPRFIQRYVNGETEISYLNIEVLNFNNGNRVKIGGGNHPDVPITLEILYTKL